MRRALESTSDDRLGESAKPSDQNTQADESSRYIFIDEVAEAIRDPIAVRNEVTNVFFVARDNVAFATANTLFQLARHPHIWTELRQIALALEDQPITFELLRSLTFFRHVYNETLRVQGPAIPTSRRAMRDTILPTGGGPDGTAPMGLPRYS